VEVTNLLETFGVPVTMCIALGWFVFRQNQWIQKDLKKDMEEQNKRLEEICIGLINAQKKLQTDFGKELSRLEGSYSSLSKIIQRLSGNGLRKHKK
jgi:hypothetical protein